MGVIIEAEFQRRAQGAGDEKARRIFFSKQRLPVTDTVADKRLNVAKRLNG
jgi:hypothetical protein